MRRSSNSIRSPMQAAQHGVSSVGLAVITTTLAVCAVFVPIAASASVALRRFCLFFLLLFRWRCLCFGAHQRKWNQNQNRAD